uniref:Uncharacterized protein n=1 Tax=Strigamia maritima TaxID=126957 RepID=T1JI50_STRMM
MKFVLISFLITSFIVTIGTSNEYYPQFNSAGRNAYCRRDDDCNEYSCTDSKCVQNQPKEPRLHPRNPKENQHSINENE